ncbi:uncharacterized protein [Ptychodera flava]|uniref:uncharacterized protein n=1 Tax=Ptychodera flava TaxID=63121 RepID=UPI003969D653
MEKRLGISEIDEIRKELREVRDWTNQQCGDIRERMNQFERRSSETGVSQGSVAIAERDAKKIALKIKTTWEVIARDVGIEGEKIKHSRGSHELTGEAAAEAFITQWIQMSADKSTTPSTPPTWDSLYNIARRHNEAVAKEIQDLRKLSK